MIYLTPRDKRKRVEYKRDEFRKLCLKFLATRQALKPSDRLFARTQIDKLSRNGSITRLRNRCIISGRGRSVYRIFGLDRYVFKKMANQGLLTGIEKTGW